METEERKNVVCDCKKWIRILYMMMFAVVLYLVMMLVGLVTVVQVIFSLFTGKPNQDLLDFSRDLSRYVEQIVAFLMYVDDRRPFPFNDMKSADDEKSDSESVEKTSNDSADSEGSSSN